MKTQKVNYTTVLKETMRGKWAIKIAEHKEGYISFRGVSCPSERFI